MNKKFSGILALVMAAIIWGGGFIATSKSLDSFGPFTITAIRFLASALLVYMVFNKDVRGVKRGEFVLGLPLGLYLFLAFCFQTFGLKYTSIANNSFLTALNVVFTPFMMWIFYDNKPSRKAFIAAFLALFGLGVLSFDGLSINFNRGDVLTIICAIFFSLHIVYASQNMDHVHYKKITFLQFIYAGAFSLIFAFIFESLPSSFSLDMFLPLVYLILFSTMTSYSLQMYGTKHVPATSVSVILSLESVFAAIFSYLFMGEVVSLRSLIAMTLLFFSVLLSSIGE